LKFHEGMILGTPDREGGDSRWFSSEKVHGEHKRGVVWLYFCRGESGPPNVGSKLSKEKPRS